MNQKLLSSWTLGIPGAAAVSLHMNGSVSYPALISSVFEFKLGADVPLLRVGQKGGHDGGPRVWQA